MVVSRRLSSQEKRKDRLSLNQHTNFAAPWYVHCVVCVMCIFCFVLCAVVSLCYAQVLVIDMCSFQFVLCAVFNLCHEHCAVTNVVASLRACLAALGRERAQQEPKGRAQ